MKQVEVYVNKVGPFFNPHETYHYYKLPVCRPEKVRDCFTDESRQKNFHIFEELTNLVTNLVTVLVTELVIVTDFIVLFTVLAIVRFTGALTILLLIWLLSFHCSCY